MSQGGTSVRDELRHAGLRATGPRQAVLEWLAEHPHATVDQIGKGVRQRSRSVSTQAVYNVLVTCAKAGLVRWIEPAGHPARYERRTGDNHHHVVCRNCGRIGDIDCAVGSQPCLSPEGNFGYKLEQAEVVFWGLCRDCSNHTGGSTAPSSSDTHYQEKERQ